jgi:hypothetical protein
MKKKVPRSKINAKYVLERRDSIAVTVAKVQAGPLENSCCDILQQPDTYFFFKASSTAIRPTQPPTRYLW